MIPKSGNRFSETIVLQNDKIFQASIEDDIAFVERVPTLRMIGRTALRISRSLFLKMLEGYPETAHILREHIGARAACAA